MTPRPISDQPWGGGRRSGRDQGLNPKVALGRGEKNFWSDRRFSQLEREEPVVGAVGQRLIPKKGPACFVEAFKNKGCNLNFRTSLTWGGMWMHCKGSFSQRFQVLNC